MLRIIAAAVGQRIAVCCGFVVWAVVSGERLHVLAGRDETEQGEWCIGHSVRKCHS